MGIYWVSFLSRTAPGFLLCVCVFFSPLHVSRPLGFAPEAALEDLGLALFKARCGGGAAAWVAGALAAPGTQGSWQLGQQET